MGYHPISSLLLPLLLPRHGRRESRGFRFVGLVLAKRADERTRTADLLITSDKSCVAGVCTSLQISHIQADFLSLLCPVLHRMAFPVVSEWCQRRPSYPRTIETSS